MSVGSVSNQYLTMAKYWEPIDAILSGTAGMRSLGEEYLPKEPLETRKSYKNRVKRSFLYEGYKDTVRTLTSKPFSKPVNVKDEPESLAYLKTNADGLGATNISQFARQLFKDGLNRGIAHFFVDFPRATGEESIAEAEELRLRPRFVRYDAKDVIGWKTDSEGRLSELRLREFVIEEDENYESSVVEYIRVYSRSEYQVFRESKTSKSKETEYELIDEGSMTIGEIPLITVYFNGHGMLLAEPPLLSLAWLNIEHWQSSSDQRNVLRMGRFATLFGSGLDSKSSAKKQIAVGVNSLITGPKDSDLKYVEHSGAAIRAGQEDIKALEDRMESMGMKPMTDRRTGNQTATAKTLETANTTNDVQCWIKELELGLVQGFGLAAKWLGIELAEGFGIDIHSDFQVGLNSVDQVGKLIDMRLSGDLSQETLHEEVYRRGMLSESFDHEIEVVRIEEEGPPLGSVSDSRNEEEGSDGS